MPVVKMEKMTVIGLTQDKEAIVESLMKLGAFEVIPGEQTEDIASDRISPIEEKINHTQSEMNRLEQAASHAKSLSVEKKSLFTLPRTVTSVDFMKTAVREKEVMETVGHLEHNTVMQDELLSQQSRLKLDNELLEPWLDLNLDLSRHGTDHVNFFIGSLDDEADIEDLKNTFRQEDLEAMVLPLKNGDPDNPESVRAIIATWKPKQEAVQSHLRRVGFNPLPLHGQDGTAAEIYQRNTAQIAENDIELEKLSQNSLELSAHLPQFEMLYDYLSIRLDRLEEMARLTGTRSTFWMEGWIPANLVKSVTKALSDKFVVAIESRPPVKGEEFPILLRNNKLVKPFEVIGEMFSPPSNHEADPSPWIAPFYFFFFGIMLSDVAYGLILSTICALLVYKVKVQGDFKRMSTMLMYCGISSTIWGFLFGGFFGDMLSVLSGGSFALPPIWFNPMDDPTRLMLLSIIFGVIHLFVGMFAKALSLIRAGRWIDAVLDVFPWYLIIVGAGLMIAGMGGSIGSILAIAGAAIIVLFGGRPTLNPIKRLVGGLGALYNVTSYLSDILSYTRILALVLATSVIAMVVNLLGFMSGPTVPGILVFIIVAIAGHALNLALSALSAYVHTSRLHYVEYFGKFYEGGGRVWKPLRQKTRYTQITKTASKTN